MAARILAIDQGTTNTKVLLIDDRGAVLARASIPVAITFPAPGWVEQDAGTIWRTVTDAIDECLAQAPGRQPDAIAITNQRESVVVWDRVTGAPVGPVVVWQCRRTASHCDRLRADGAGPLIARKTSLTIDPLFSATKLHWLIEHAPDGRRRAAAGDLCAGTIDSWVVWNLTGGRVHACDTTNASRTQLFDLTSCTWDAELLDLFDVPAAVLPAIRPSSGVVGGTVAVGRLAAGIPVAALIGDSHAALFGHAAFRPGAVKATYGTGSSLMTPTPARVDVSGLSSTVAWSLGHARTMGARAVRPGEGGPDAPPDMQYALEGNITDAGSAVDWAGRLLGSDRPDRHVAALAATVADSGGVYLVPAFAGLGAPHWDDRARGLVCGLTRGTGPAEIARAALESIAYQVHDVFEVMTRSIAVSRPMLLADGGASRNDELMQFQADVLGAPVVRNTSTDLSAVGAAWLAGLAIGAWHSLADLERIPRSVDRFEPRMPPAGRERLLAGWRAAVDRARYGDAS